MEFGLSQEQVMLQNSVNRFLNENSALDQVRQFAENADNSDIWQGLTDIGIPGLLIPESAGGIGLSCLDATVVAEALGYHTTPVPYLGSSIMAPLALSLSGNTDSEVLSQLALGAFTAGVAVSESINARNSRTINCTDNKLSGTARYVLDYGSSVYLVSDSNQALYLVDADASGISQRTLATVDKTRPTGELVFANTPATLITADPNIWQQVINVGRVILAADTLGAAQNMLDQAVEYAKQREQFNRVIASFQAVKHMCAEMAAAIEPSRSLVWYAAHAQSEVPEEATLTACHAKAHLAEVGQFVARTSTEVHGGMGFTDLVGLHYWFKRIGFNRQILGGPEFVRDEAARAQGLIA